MSKRVRELEKIITKNKALYYQGKPEISDEEYDQFELELAKLDKSNPVLAMVGSPIDDKVEKVQHQKKMLSLEKTYVSSDVEKFLDTGELISVFKIDGSSCSLIYSGGHLEIAKTRGDGSQGENISKKVTYISEIPKSIDDKAKLEIRGEIFCTSEGFHHILKEMESLGLEKPTSQRNIVAGLLGRKEHFVLARHLSFQAFDVIGSKFKKEEEKLEFLKKIGFTIPEWEKHSSAASITKRIEEAKTFMSEGEYLIDGLVFVLNDLKLHEELGETGHHPRYKLAFKFQGATKVTKINEITWQVSRNGRLTPVAEIEPTELSGAVINRVTLHNYGLVSDFSLKPGDEIEIVRSGEVIPKFLSVVKSSGGDFKIPTKCPSCLAPLRVEDIWLMCLNDKCPAKQLETILHWIKQSKIEDLSEKRLQEMISKGLVVSIADLYRLNMEDLLRLDKVKDKLATKLYENIQKTKVIDLVVFMAAIGVEGVSNTKAEKIVANGHNSIEKLLELSAESLAEIEGFATKSAGDIVNSLKLRKSLIKDLLKVGLTITTPEVVEGGVLEGKKLCITGALSVPRSEIEGIIKKNAGIVVSSVSKNTDYLLTNDTDPSSSKYKKALGLGTKIITEAEFRKLIGV